MTRAEQREQTRIGVLAAADRLFVEHGFHATSVDEIAQAAGYTKGAVYSNFAAKEDVFFAVYERRMERAVVELERTLAASDDPAGWIESAIADTSTPARARRSLAVDVLRVLGARDPPPRRCASASRRSTRAWSDRSSPRSSATPMTTARRSRSTRARSTWR